MIESIEMESTWKHDRMSEELKKFQPFKQPAVHLLGSVPVRFNGLRIPVYLQRDANKHFCLHNSLCGIIDC